MHVDLHYERSPNEWEGFFETADKMVSLVIGNLEFDETSKSFMTEWPYGGKTFTLQGKIGRKKAGSSLWREIRFTLDA